MDPIMPILKVAAAIQPAAAILVYIWDEVMKVEANKERLVDLLRRCHKILGAIDEEIAKRPDQDVRRACERLMRNMTFLKTIVERLARMSFIRALLHRDDISREINECHIKLSDCLTLFQVSAAVDLRNYVRAMREAQERDQQTLLQQLEKLEKNDMEIMNVLKVVGNQMEAMLAMQKV
ncbi:hypothetical protein FRC03_007634 [Tulasnella sp. 419]|nr:hypothetical protein FRC03_007634 [Tulasnella sp. 419]